MKRFMIGAALLLPAAAYAQYTPVTATHVRYGGTDITTGSVTMTLVDGSGNPQPFFTSDGAIQGPQGFTAAVTAGALAAGFAPPNMCTAVAAKPSTPLHYRVDVNKQLSAQQTATYSFEVPTSSSYFCGSTAVTLDHYAPAQITTYVTGLVSSSTVPSSCTAPSKLYTPTSPVVNYDCVAGHYVVETSTGSASLTLTTTGTSGAATFSNGH